MSDPIVVFVFDIKHWYNSISAVSKVDLLDIVPHVSVQFGFDFQSQAYLMVISKSKWESLSGDVKKKFMLISRRVKEEMDGIMLTAQREAYENSDIFAAFATQTTSQPQDTPLETIPEAGSADGDVNEVLETIESEVDTEPSE